MKTTLWFLFCTTALVSAGESTELSLVKELEPLQRFIGKTWRGHFRKSTPEKPVIDTAKWERALNGRAIRITHSVNNGAYGGESIITWNRETQKVQFHYFTTAGFMTHGTMRFEENKLITHEVVSGNGNGVSEVENIFELRPDGRMQSKARHLKAGEWAEGPEILYEVAPDAQVVFR